MPQACSSMVREYGSSPAIHACTLCHNTPNVGRALITGEWSDLNRFKVPVLRGCRGAPYFHNGAFTSLRAVVSFLRPAIQHRPHGCRAERPVACLRSL